jgi:hypothetical protein
MLVLSFSFFGSQNYALAGISLVISMIFIVFMIKNIAKVKKMRKDKK